MENFCACCAVEDEENFVALNGRDKKLNDTFSNLLFRITGLKFHEQENLKICFNCLYTLKKSIEFVEMCIKNNKNRVLSQNVPKIEISQKQKDVKEDKKKSIESYETRTLNKLKRQASFTAKDITENVPVILNQVLRTKRESPKEVHPAINYSPTIVNKQCISTESQSSANIYTVEFIEEETDATHENEQTATNDESFVVESGDDEDNLPISKLIEESNSRPNQDENETSIMVLEDEKDGAISQPEPEGDAITVPAKKKNSNFLCSICGKSFQTNQRLRMHGLVHSDEKNFVCPEENCEKRFATEFRLKVHQRIHKGEKPYKCKFPDCGASFAQGNALTCHNRIHTKSKPYKCQVCEKSFTQNTILKTHMALHLGKTIECPYPGCEKKFARKSFLKVHSREHTGEKPFKCTYQNCTNSYMQKSHLSRHMDTHIGVTHKCPECTKSYTKAWSLKLHMYSHTQTKPYKCSLCDSSFLRRDKLNKHMNKIHTDNEQQSKLNKDKTEIVSKTPENQPQVVADARNSYVLLQTNPNTNVSQIIGEIFIENT